MAVPAVLAAIGAALLSFKDLIIRFVIIAICLVAVIAIAGKLFSFASEIGTFITANKPGVPVLGYIEVANQIVPVGEAVNMMISLVVLRISCIVVRVGFMIYRFIFALIAHSD